MRRAPASTVTKFSAEERSRIALPLAPSASECEVTSRKVSQQGIERHEIAVATEAGNDAEAHGCEH